MAELPARCEERRHKEEKIAIAKAELLRPPSGNFLQVRV